MDGLAEAIGTVVASVFSSGIIAAAIANRAAYKSIAVEAITKERITWLDELRAIAADLTARLAAVNRANKPVSEETLFALDRVIAQLQLHLNPGSEAEKENEIISLAEELQKVAEKGGNTSEWRDNYRPKEKEFMLAVRELLKAEWEKAKSEAGVEKKND
mgnify:CR=1 FL=1